MPDDPQHRVVVPVSPVDREQLAAQLWRLGATGIWEQPGRTIAWFRDAPDLAELAALVPGLAPEAIIGDLEPDRDWQAAWKATIEPVTAGRFTVVPSWLADDHVPATAEEHTLVLDPGRAFGSGHHATTTLCLELLDDLHRAHGLDGRSVADVGCGSGVLAIAAASCGARAIGVDIDPEAVAVTRENAERNAVALTARHGSVEALDAPADVVLANLVTDVVIGAAIGLTGATRRWLIVSGITVERAEDALTALADAGAQVVERRTRDGWIAALLEVSERGDAGGPAPRASGRTRSGTTRIAGLAALAVLLVAGCTAPAPDEEETEPEDDTATEAAPAEEPTPEVQGLLATAQDTITLLDEARGRLDAASAATGDERTRLLDEAEALLVTDPASGTRALFPSEPAERTTAREADDALTELVTAAREAGGPTGRAVLAALRDVVAGDLGAWELDAPGMVATAQGIGSDADGPAAIAAGLDGLDGQATKALAWIAGARALDDPLDRRSAIEHASDHLDAAARFLETMIADPVEVDEPGEDELGVPEPAEER